MPEVDEAIAAWPAQVLADAELVAEIERVRRSGSPGRAGRNSLGQKLLQLAGPGVPDVYQGTELFEYSLVDPDNRRPVDWAARRELLARLDDGWLPEVDAAGAAKLLVTASALRLRRYRPEVFTGYRPLPAAGPGRRPRGRLPALGRRWSRWPPGCRSGWPRRGGWGDTVLPLPGRAPPTGATSSPARRSTAPRPRLADAARPLPGGAAGAAGIARGRPRHVPYHCWSRIAMSVTSALN